MNEQVAKAKLVSSSDLRRHGCVYALCSLLSFTYFLRFFDSYTNYNIGSVFM